MIFYGTWVDSEVKCPTGIWSWNISMTFGRIASNRFPVTADSPLRRCSRMPFNCRNFKTRPGWNRAVSRESKLDFVPGNGIRTINKIRKCTCVSTWVLIWWELKSPQKPSRSSCYLADSRCILFQESLRWFKQWSVSCRNHLTPVEDPTTRLSMVYISVLNMILKELQLYKQAEGIGLVFLCPQNW